jgi:hypothetical protein
MAADFIGSTRTPSKRLRPDRQGEQPAQGKARSSRCSRGRKWSPLQAVLMALSCLRNKDPAFGMHFRKMFPPSSSNESLKVLMFEGDNPQPAENSVIHNT